MDKYKDDDSKESLVERAKELECLYMIDEALNENSLPEVLIKSVQVIPLGFRKMEACVASIILDGNYYTVKEPINSKDELYIRIVVDNILRGFIHVAYPENTFSKGENIFLDQEIRLLKTASNKISDKVSKMNLDVNITKDVIYDNVPAAIPNNISYKDTIFTNNKNILNGKITGIKTVIYIDSMEYSKLDRQEELEAVNEIIKAVNQVLPRKSFILIEPGLLGNKKDKEVGEGIAISDINNTSIIISMEQGKWDNPQQLLYKSTFFQELKKENIKHMILYPESNEVIFNKPFFSIGKNDLSNILPSYSRLEDVVRIIKVDKNNYGKELNILMNADLEKAIAYITDSTETRAIAKAECKLLDSVIEDGWKWRHYMAEKIASQIDMESFGVVGVYLFGSTNNCTAKHNSDIDLLIHFEGTDKQKHNLDIFLNGWSMALSEINFLKTGYKSDGLLDVHYVSEQDIINGTSFAILINSVYDPALPLRLKKEN